MHTVSNPLLLAVDKVVLAIRCQFGFSANVSDVRSSPRFSDGQTDDFFTAQARTSDLILEWLARKLEHRRQTCRSGEDTLTRAVCN
jgi:hypothetical protein